MTHTVRLRRPLAGALALAIVAAGLALAPIASASAASDTHNAALLLGKLNAYRTKAGVTGFSSSVDLQHFSQDMVDYYVAHNASWAGYNPNDPSMTPPPAGAYASNGFIYRVTGDQTAAIAALAKKHRDFSLDTAPKAFLFDSTLNYAGAGFAKKGNYTYGYIAQYQYDAKPQTTVRPSISGKRAVGSTVKATFSGWNPTPADPKFQWYANGVALSGEKSSTFVIGSGSLGKTLSVKVASAASGYTNAARLSLDTKAVVRGTIAAKTPVVTGIRVAKQTLTAKAGDWGSGVTLTYQWLRNGVAISGAAESTYRVRSADLRKRVDVRVTGTRNGFTTATRTTSTSAKVLREFVTVKPTVSGSGQAAGTVLMAKVGTWTPAADEYTYRWKRDGANISKATSKKYTVTKADVGHTLTVTITGSKSTYLTVAVTSVGRPVGAP